MYLDQNLEGGVMRALDSSEESSENAERNGYEQYREVGGIINEQDYKSALERAKDTNTIDRALIAEAELMAETSGIALENSKDALDPRVALYGTLRIDTNHGEQYHHSQMNDQRLFAEVLRMLGDTESLDKLMKEHPNIFEEKEQSQSEAK